MPSVKLGIISLYTWIELQPRLCPLIKPCPLLGFAFSWVDFILRVSPYGFKMATSSSWHLSYQFTNTSKWEFLFLNTWIEAPALSLTGLALSTCYSCTHHCGKIGGMLWLPGLGHIPPTSPRAPACCPDKDQGDITRRDTDLKQARMPPGYHTTVKISEE